MTFFVCVWAYSQVCSFTHRLNPGEDFSSPEYIQTVWSMDCIYVALLFTHTLMRRCCIQRFFITHHSYTAVWGNVGLSVLHKACGQREPDIEPSTFWLLDDPLYLQSHSLPIICPEAAVIVVCTRRMLTLRLNKKSLRFLTDLNVLRFCTKHLV